MAPMSATTSNPQSLDCSSDIRSHFVLLSNLRVCNKLPVTTEEQGQIKVQDVDVSLKRRSH